MKLLDRLTGLKLLILKSNQCEECLRVFSLAAYCQG